MVRSSLHRGFWLGVVVWITLSCSNPGADFGNPAASQAPPDPNRAPPGATTGPSGQGWVEVWEKVADCGAAKCPGAQGFGVTSDGRYYVGASSPQSTSSGTLPVTEQQLVAKMAAAVAGQTFTPSARCMDTDPAPGATIDVSIRIQLVGSQQPIAIYETSNSGKHTCVRGDLDTAAALRDTLAPVIAKYDPVPLPTPVPTSTGHPSPTPRPTFPWPFP
jgi:hypothetical protein